MKDDRNEEGGGGRYERKGKDLAWLVLAWLALGWVGSKRETGVIIHGCDNHK